MLLLARPLLAWLLHLVHQNVAPWFGFGDCVDETHMFCNVGALLHVAITHSPDGFDLLPASGV